jgi:hypothetical protein
MIILTDDAVLKAVCSAHGQWGIMAYFHFKDDLSVEYWRDEIMDATKGLVDTSKPEHFYVSQTLVSTGEATVYMLFDSEAEMHDAFFNRIYGDDNSDAHGYFGCLHTIRCLTCTPTGELENENS